MKKMNNTRGSVFLDVMAAMFIMTMTAIVVYNTVFFNMKTLDSIKNNDEIVAEINDEITIILAKKQYKDKSSKDWEILYSKKYAGSIDGSDFYQLNIDISQERSGIKRRYEILISE
ncbi:hypothetical protein [Proteocatella sphenisci]|uniref:hypothetical protein n=1 Tax=Proteocatella sphenisci TaxID=181070 RepID=UPI000491B35C|nr:hypothetical protein [Proteocatella sphenisci]